MVDVGRVREGVCVGGLGGREGFGSGRVVMAGDEVRE